MICLIDRRLPEHDTAEGRWILRVVLRNQAVSFRGSKIGGRIGGRAGGTSREAQVHLGGLVLGQCRHAGNPAVECEGAGTGVACSRVALWGVVELDIEEVERSSLHGRVEMRIRCDTLGGARDVVCSCRGGVKVALEMIDHSRVPSRLVVRKRGGFNVALDIKIEPIDSSGAKRPWASRGDPRCRARSDWSEGAPEELGKVLSNSSGGQRVVGWGTSTN